MARRTLKHIKDYLKPEKIYQLITNKTCKYKTRRPFHWCRDRAFMAMAFGSAGRVTAICGGERYETVDKKLEVAGTHPGICRKNFEISESHLVVKGMTVVKRAQSVIRKYGEGVTTRNPFAFPLECSLHENAYWDQLVPFGWLIVEYLERFKPEDRLFKFSRYRGWQIVNYVTGMWPHWFRAQSEHFYGYYIHRHPIKLAEFVKIIDVTQVKDYVGSTWDADLKPEVRKKQFEWIPKAVEEIKSRMR